MKHDSNYCAARTRHPVLTQLVVVCTVAWQGLTVIIIAAAGSLRIIQDTGNTFVAPMWRSIQHGSWLFYRRLYNPTGHNTEYFWWYHDPEDEWVFSV